MSLQEVKVGTSAIPLFHVINTSKCIFYIIYMIQGFLQGQRSFSRSSKLKYDCYKIKLVHGNLTGKYICCIILVIDGHLQSQKVKIMTIYFSTYTNITSFW